MSSSEMPAAWRCKHGVLTGLQGLTVIARRAEAMGSSEGAKARGIAQSLAFLYGERWQDMSSSKMPATWRCKHGVLTGLQGLTVIAIRAEALGSSEVLAF